MLELNNLDFIAHDMLNNNSFMTVINALWNNNLDSLIIVKTENRNSYSGLNNNEKEKLLIIMHNLCKRKSETTWYLREAAL